MFLDTEHQQFTDDCGVFLPYSLLCPPQESEWVAELLPFKATPTWLANTSTDGVCNWWLVLMHPCWLNAPRQPTLGFWPQGKKEAVRRTPQ